MSAATEGVRVLALGNDLLADDGAGILVAEELRRRFPALDVVVSGESGFRLLDSALGVARLVVVDTVRTGAPPGTIHVVREEDVDHVPGGSPHYVGLFEALRAGRAMALPVPGDVLIVAVEPADCETLGGPLHPDVEQALPKVADLVAEAVAAPS